ncbi:MAG: imidazole glycerol phosphate synthase subunit HisF [Candidatus Omnitrophica bacterium]|nr:imidazole glycerol phosphate synthase subunit HisF [Candidatus Omnitrophota bacterium]
MLAKRIIPCLDIKAGRVVKGVRFVRLRDAGDPVEIARIYEKEGADELVFLDITASFQKRKILIELVEAVAKNIFMPFTVGGGIKSLEEIRDILKAGADKISLNTWAVKKPSLIKKASDYFGNQCIVVAIDAKLIKTEGETKSWQVYINGGRTPTDLDAMVWAEEVANLGAGEILLTSMDFDGTKKGFDLELTRRVSEVVNIPVVASGGAGRAKDFYDLFLKTNADAGLAASIFHYGEYSVGQIKKYLYKKGIPIRLNEI